MCMHESQEVIINNGHMELNHLTPNQNLMHAVLDRVSKLVGGYIKGDVGGASCRI